MSDKKPDPFFQETLIRVDVPNGEVLKFYMRPLKVKEISLAMRVSNLKNSEEMKDSYLPELTKLVAGTVDKEIDSLPLEYLDPIIKAFYDLNYPDHDKEDKEKNSAADLLPSVCASVFDSLIYQGHSMIDIMEYTIPQVSHFQTAASDRIKGVKRGDAEKILSAAGVVSKPLEEL